MPVKLITVAAEEPVGLEEFKAHLRITGDDTQDPDLTIKLRAAREKLEGGTQTARAFVSSVWDQYADHWPCWSCASCFCRTSCSMNGRHEHSDSIMMPKGQLVSVASIKYTDASGVQTTWPTTEYEVDTVSDPGRIVLAYGKQWPSVTLKRSNAIVIRFTAGWENASAVPFPIKAAILLEAAHFYRNREAVTTGRLDMQSSPLAHGVDDLLWAWRIRGVAQ